MAVDNKYGEVILEHGSIGEDEPVVVFRARDILLPELLDCYLQLCRYNGSPPRHLELIAESKQQIINWQQTNGNKLPTSEASKEWMNDSGTS